MDLSVFYSYLYDRIHSKIFTKEDVSNYINELIDFLELNEYLSEIVFTPDRYANMAAYNLGDRKIKVALQAIINEARMTLNMMKRMPDNNGMINAFILETLLHEITHIYHNYLITECDNDISKVFRMQLEYFYSDDPFKLDQYNYYYNKLIFERDASITAIENILRIIMKYSNDKQLYKYYYKELKKFILTGYKEYKDRVLSPIEVIQSEIFATEPLIVENIDLYDKFRLGFMVSKEEYSYFKENIDEIILSKNNLHR